MIVEDADLPVSESEDGEIPEETDREHVVKAEVDRLFRHDGGDPLMRGVKAALLEFRIGK